MTVTIHTQGTNATSTGTAVSGALPGVLTGGYPTLIRVASSGAGYFKLGSGTAAAGDLMIQPADHVILTVPEGIYGFSWISLTGTTTVNVEAIEWGHRPIPSSTLDLNFLTTLTTPSAIGAAGITFSRAYTAGTNHSGTYFGSDGLLKEAKVNLLLQSNTFNVTWSTADLTPTQTQTGIDGTTSAWLMTAGGTTNSVCAQNSAAVPAGSAITGSIYAKRGNGDWLRVFVGEQTSAHGVLCWFNLATGTTGTMTLQGSGASASRSITAVGNGWYRIVITVTPNGSYTVPRIYFNVASADASGTGVAASTYVVTGAQLETGSTASQYIPTQAAASAAPRIEYDPVTLECKGLLIEEQRTNLHPASNSWSNNSGVSQATVTQNYASPSGSADAWTVTEGGAGLQFAYGVAATVSTTAAAHTFSAFVKAGTATRCQLCTNTSTSSFYANFGLSGDGAKLAQSGTTDYGIQKLANGWYRIWAVVTTAAASVGNPIVSHINSDSAARLPSYTGTGLTLYLFGGQVEPGAFPTSYIPTTTTSLTRAADSCSIAAPYFSPWYNQAEGTIVASVDTVQSLAGLVRVFEVDSGSTADFWSLLRDTAVPSVRALLTLNSVSQYDTISAATSGTFTVGTSASKVAAAISNGLTADSITGNGLTAYNTTAKGTLPSTRTMTTLFIGNRRAGDRALNGHIYRLVYFNKRLPDTALQQLTGN